MRAKITENGVLIPRELLNESASEVEIYRKGDRVVVVPIAGADLLQGTDDGASPALNDDDPIWNWGADPIDDGPEDASISHDKYIYGSPHGE